MDYPVADGEILLERRASVARESISKLELRLNTARKENAMVFQAKENLEVIKRRMFALEKASEEIRRGLVHAVRVYCEHLDPDKPAPRVDGSHNRRSRDGVP